MHCTRHPISRSLCLPHGSAHARLAAEDLARAGFLRTGEALFGADLDHRACERRRRLGVANQRAARVRQRVYRYERKRPGGRYDWPMRPRARARAGVVRHRQHARGLRRQDSLGRPDGCTTRRYFLAQFPTHPRSEKGMIIDVNACLGHYPFRQLRFNTAATMIDLMDRNGIDRAVVSSLYAVFYRDAHRGNEELREATQRHTSRFIPVATVNPKYVGWERDLAQAIETWKMKVVTL